ncbi:MAG: DUF4276 family protein [Actinomycetota bacterium]|nr:DUF4276 family protein [Actinomycetota bacterium]
MTTQPVIVEILVEEPSAAKALDLLLPKIVPGVPYFIREFRGKDMLLKELPARLRGYAGRLRQGALRVVVLVDRDDDDCGILKDRLNRHAWDAGLSTSWTGGQVQLLNRIAVEELEAWFFGDVPALCLAYPRVPASLGEQAKFRDPDAIAGGTWEALERLLMKHRYHVSGLRKLQAASEIASFMDVENNRSKSFQVFRDGLRRLVNEEHNAQAY